MRKAKRVGLVEPMAGVKTGEAVFLKPMNYNLGQERKVMFMGKKLDRISFFS
ncbi:MAG: hypothetical protein J7L26_05845 [Candidatus Aminicenantes bacterium]|nr:hypothetical protein [Candidatus Aminicenantes bacterium]